MSNYDKFRLLWRNNPQKQYDALQEMVMHLQNVANGITDINVKLNVLPQIITAINNQSLLLQAVADNTACACNGISQVNDNLASLHDDLNTKLDKIIELLGQNPPVPAPVFVFVLSLTSVDITPEIINAGSFILSGVSTKDGEVFDQLTLVDEFDFIDSVNVISDTQVAVELVPGAEIPEGTLTIQLKQAESNIIQQFNIYYEAPPAPVLNFVRLSNGTVLPLTSFNDISLLCTSGEYYEVITIDSYSFSKYSVVAVVITDGALFVNNVVPANFCREFTSLIYVTLPDTITVLESGFLLHCVSFNRPLTLPSGIVSIGSHFLYYCTSYNSPIVLPATLASIGSYFMAYAVAFTLPLTLPDSLTAVGDWFMYKAESFTGPLSLGSLSASIFSASPTAYTLCISDSSAIPYTNGLVVLGNDANAFRTRFPNRNTSPYRNLLPYGIVPTPGRLDFPFVAGSQSVKLTSTLPWHYDNYTDDQGITHEGVLPDWLQLDIQSGTHGTFNLTFTVTKNMSAAPRYASLTFTTGETSSSIIIEQAALVLDRHFQTILNMNGSVLGDDAKVNAIVNVKTAQKQYEFINSGTFPADGSVTGLNWSDIIPSTDTTPIAWASVTINGDFQAAVSSTLSDDSGVLATGDAQFGSLYYAGPVIGNLLFKADFDNR